MREQDVRAAFAALNARGAPPLAVTAEDLIECGDRVRKRRKKTLAAACTGLAVAVVLAGVFVALPEHRAPGEITPARLPDSTSIFVPPDAPPMPEPVRPPGQR
ncbi:hypothetical protein NLX83_34585 [Allokutzneria sp. A3M-2-11 16]|uniref:hypothetical protein n=1 Tax=Allokutzneria sp. A3M-2-11 16 TaxID=2962043 RepID=UPI0020B64845|nr:hypothetical protein [Allokutzneria sp. A3M-2-11 16]MCP3804408.1 hypothetical protein [Allokutzneria sp. A3M-2-11 16]